MKVMQTLGRHSGFQEGIFQYRRDAGGVLIDARFGAASLNPNQIRLTHDEWGAILNAIDSRSQNSFRLSGQPPFQAPPNQSLYELLQSAVPNPVGGWTWNDSWKSYVCAILEHEGTMDLYHGLLGPNDTAIICLSKDR